MQEPALALRATRLAFQSLGALAPEPMAALAERLYFSPRRHRMPAREKILLEDAVAFHVSTPAGELAAWRWAPWFPWERALRGTVLLVHGWEGRGAQLGAFIQPLLEQGFAVVAMDAPAHGVSPGDAVDLPLYAECLHALADNVGGVSGIVAHSFGCAATVIALESGLQADSVVLVAPPCSLVRFADTFSQMVGLTRATEAIFRARLEQRFGREWWRTFALDAKAQHLTVPALVIHDADDAEVPASEGARLAEAWRGARYLETRGLGHRRLLRDDAVVGHATRFIGEVAEFAEAALPPELAAPDAP